ncbi:MAG: TRAP transporter substrate-binding protein [Alphaproteobacteria bacterium]|nr:TRAP transporter substrate-binding protein [Alphaproteobacteria bacterium]
MDRRRFLTAGLAGAVAAPLIGKYTGAQAQAQVTLKLHHFLPPMSNGHAHMLAPWAKQVEADSAGRIKIDIFPSMQLGGTPPQLYDQARDGVVDIVWTLPGSTAGRFPTTEVFELPFVAARRGIVNAKASQEFANAHLKDEVKDVKILSYWAHDHGLIHANKLIKTMEDLKGLKLRNPTRLAGEALKALGAVSVGMPVPQVPEALAQKVIDGAVVPWEVVPAVKVHELVKFHTEIPGSPTLYTASFFLAMNKAKYDGLPADLKAVLDKSSTMAFAERAGTMWDEQGAKVEAMVRARGNTISAISQEEKARWIKACEPVAEAWIKQVKEKGLDGGKLIDAARALVAKHDKA